MIRMLLIEDNLEIRENTTELLELNGYQVTTAVDGRVGIVATSVLLPEVILCDTQMPFKTGHEVLLAVRENPVTSKTPFIFFSTRVEKKEIQTAMKLGANGYVCKPFEPNEMFEVIERAVERANEKKSLIPEEV